MKILSQTEGVQGVLEWMKLHPGAVNNQYRGPRNRALAWYRAMLIHKYEVSMDIVMQITVSDMRRILQSDDRMKAVDDYIAQEPEPKTKRLPPWEECEIIERYMKDQGYML